MIWKILAKSKLAYFIFIYYFIVCIFWLKILFSGQVDGFENYLFNIIYGGIAIIGGIHGLYISFKKWGGYRSVIGRGLILFSLGLLGQWFGNIVWGYTNIVLKIEIPYPGLADVGFFSIIPLYAWGIIELSKAVGIKLSLKTFRGQIQAIAIPFFMVAISWTLFLRDIPFDISNPLKLFLDYGYPGGEAITVSLAIITYSLSRGILGGKMRGRILLIIFALLAQYVTDYLFLYKAGTGTYHNAGLVDLLYASSYTIMSLGLIAFKDYE